MLLDDNTLQQQNLQKLVSEEIRRVTFTELESSFEYFCAYEVYHIIHYSTNTFYH